MVPIDPVGRSDAECADDADGEGFSFVGWELAVRHGVGE
jgi:hypothetical protein